MDDILVFPNKCVKFLILGSATRPKCMDATLSIGGNLKGILSLPRSCSSPKTRFGTQTQLWTRPGGLTRHGIHTQLLGSRLYRAHHYSLDMRCPCMDSGNPGYPHK